MSYVLQVGGKVFYISRKQLFPFPIYIYAGLQSIVVKIVLPALQIDKLWLSFKVKAITSAQRMDELAALLSFSLSHLLSQQDHPEKCFQL